jgi:AAHS family 4-hydroxybenzoate transporter-like MFS transporter
MSASPQPHEGEGGILDVAEFIGRLPFGRFHFGLVALCCLVTFLDGVDLGIIAYAAPYIRDDLQLSGQQLGLVFSSATVGQILGALLFSYLADRVGRRPVILVCAVLAGLFTLAMGFAGTFGQLLAVRFASGLAIGGLLPVAWALNIEAMPDARRATVVSVIMFGFTLGGAVAAPLTNLVAPHWGWQWIYLLSGFATLLVALILVAMLPESARFLASRAAPPARIAALLRRADPRFEPRAWQAYRLRDEKPAQTGFTPRDLFRGRLKFITPMIWAAYFFSSIAAFLGALWGPIYFEQLGMTRENAALLGSSAGLAGAIISVVLMRFTESLGPRWVALFPLLAAPTYLLVGIGAAGPALLAPAIFTGLVLKYGGHQSVISIIGTFYPSSIRANAGGWASAIAKVGGVIGPILGAFFVANAGGAYRAFLLLSACTLLVGLCVLSLARFARRAAECPPTTR